MAKSRRPLLKCIAYAASLLSFGTINNAFVIDSYGLMIISHSGTLGNISMQKITAYINIGTASDGRMEKQV